ncbi:MAG: hypothetical protein ACR2J0_03825 [Mycobacteriales bacterium]|jgi:hypothetical protein
MATQQQCEAALQRVAATLAGSESGDRSRQIVDRSVSCTVPDLGLTFTGQLQDGALSDMASTAAGSAPPAQIRLTVGSDDLVALTDGRLGFGSAWAHGRLKVEASMLDLLRLRRLL